MAGAEDDVYTYDNPLADGGPFVPDITDLGGDEMADDPQTPPQKGVDWYSGAANEHGRNIAGLNRVFPGFCALYIEWDSGASEWIIVYVDAMGTLVESASFTLTPVSTGVVTIAWTAGTLPAMSRKPLVQATDGFGHGYGTILSANSVQVRMRSEAGSPAAENFVVFLK